jgi:hypothetical protein
MLQIPSQLRLGCRSKEGKLYANLLYTKRLDTLLFIAEDFKDCFVGKKAIEFDIWRHTLLNHRGNNEVLKTTQEIMRSMRDAHKEGN